MTKIPKLLAAPLLVAVALGAAPAALAQAPAAAAAAPAFSAEQLEQMVAPIALYPDSLVTQVLMAATYPLEIVEAARWVGKNAGMKSGALEAALKDQDWDPSVKSLCGFPDLLTRMNENLDWTTDLGDAFLDQESELMDAIQRMRGKAYETGQLESTKEQTVTQQPDKIIIIQSADPQVVYVPTYSSTVVYGAPPYPYYPAVYAPPGYGALAFTAGVAWGAAMWGNANWGWGSSDVNINVNNYNNFNKNTNINGGNTTNLQNRSGNSAQWNHDPAHRQGANYKSGATAQKYGAQGGQNRVSQSQARGYSGSQGGAGQRPSTSQGGAGQRPSTSQAGAGTGGSRGASSSGARPSAGTSSSAFSGSRSGGASASSASSRGASSRGSSGGGASRSGGGGGGSRGGGGGGGRR